MFCSNCGKEMKEDVRFCPYCGMEQTLQSHETQWPSMPELSGNSARETAKKKISPKKRMAVILAGVLVLIVAALSGVFLLLHKDADEIAGQEENQVEGLQENQQEAPLYSDVQLNAVDLNAGNVTPLEKAPGMEWDSSLFYWLEDCDSTSETDGNIARCRISKTQMLIEGELIQYEIYYAPDTDEICKIVSIRQAGDELELIDYYYQNGKPNFIFERRDSVYTPTYATIDKVGERFYFNNDVMVRWRIIREPKNIEEYTLAPSDQWYSQMDYFEQNEDIRKLYDDTEAYRLNQAYNTWNAVMSDPGIGTVEGCVKDTTGTPVSGALVSIYRQADEVLLYRMETGEDGRFQTYIYLDGESCYLTVSGDEEVYKTTLVKGLELSGNADIHAYDNLILHRIAGDEYPVHLTVRAANETITQDESTVLGESLKDLTVNFREGSDSRDGEVLLTVKTDGNGNIVANLPSGSYTAELLADGYITTWLTVEVMEQETYCNGWVIPVLADNNQTAVVLTWDGEDIDLDLTIFTPSQSTGGDMAHIGGAVTSDRNGNYLVSDNVSLCEVIYLNTGETGNFKVYVNDYTNSMAGNYTADRLAALNVHVYIYNGNGLAEEYAYPSGQNGVVWEVAEVNGLTVTPGQRVYTDIRGKSWWLEDKTKSALRPAYEAYIDIVSNSYKESPWDLQDYEEASWYLYDIDGDMIPELYGMGCCMASGGKLYTYANGRIEELDIDRGCGSFAEGKNFIRNDSGNMGTYYSWWYIITENGFEQIFNGDQKENEKFRLEQPEDWDETYYDYWIDGEPCSLEEYKAGERQTIIQYLGEDYVAANPGILEYEGWKYFGEGNDGEGRTSDEMIAFLQEACQ